MSKGVQNLVEGYEALFDFILEKGVSQQEALEILKDLPEQNERYLRVMANISVCLTLIKTDLEKRYPEWVTMSIKEKDDLLWSLGMDTKKYGYHERLAWVSVPTAYSHRKELVDVYYGQERLDDEWLNLKVDVGGIPGLNYFHRASQEARTFVWNRKCGVRSVEEAMQ